MRNAEVGRVGKYALGLVTQQVKCSLDFGPCPPPGHIFNAHIGLSLGVLYVEGEVWQTTWSPIVYGLLAYGLSYGLWAYEPLDQTGGQSAGPSYVAQFESEFWIWIRMLKKQNQTSGTSQ